MVTEHLINTIFGLQVLIKMITWVILCVLNVIWSMGIRLTQNLYKTVMPEFITMAF
jgi:hypothetical protein